MRNEVYYAVMYEELFRNRGLSLDRLHALLGVAEAGSIARAARKDPVRQSQISRQLSELEAYFGCALTERKSGRRVLTEDGRRLAEHTRWTLAGLADIKRGRARESDPPFKLGAGESTLAWLVLPRLADVSARFSVSALAAEDVVRGLVDGRLDLGIVRRDHVGSKLSSRPVGAVEHALFVPRAVVPRGLDESEIPFRVPIALQTSDHDIHSRMMEEASRKRETLDVRLECESFLQVYRAVLSERYAGLLPTLVRSELPKGRFLEIGFGGRHASRLHLAWSPSLLRVRPGAERVLASLAEVIMPR